MASGPITSWEVDGKTVETGDASTCLIDIISSRLSYFWSNVNFSPYSFISLQKIIFINTIGGVSLPFKYYKSNFRWPRCIDKWSRVIFSNKCVQELNNKILDIKKKSRTTIQPLKRKKASHICHNMDDTKVMLSEINQTQENKYCMISLTCEI